MAGKKAPAEVVMTIGEMIDTAYDLREQRKAIEAQAAKLKAQQDELEDKILAELDKQGIESTSAKQCQAVVVESIVPTVKDWALFHAWIIKTKQPFMLERRAAAGPFRELIESGGKVPPGVEKFVKRDVSLRKL